MAMSIAHELIHQIHANDSSFFVESCGVSFAPQASACDNETFYDLLDTCTKKEHAEDRFTAALGLIRENCEYLNIACDDIGDHVVVA